eukprot:gene60-1744_t
MVLVHIEPVGLDALHTLATQVHTHVNPALFLERNELTRARWKRDPSQSVTPVFTQPNGEISLQIADITAFGQRAEHKPVPFDRTCGLQPSWKQIKADDNGQAQNACPSSSALIYFMALTIVINNLSLLGHISWTPCESHNGVRSTLAA